MSTCLSRALPSDLETLIGLEALTFPEDPWSDVMLAEELASPASRTTRRSATQASRSAATRPTS